MRLFIAMEPNAVAKAALVAFREEMRSRTRGRFVRDEQLHLTLHFLGEMKPGSVSGIAAAMDPVADSHAPSILILDKPDMFRSTAVMRVKGTLTPLHRALANAMLPLGVRPDNRPYRPHITIARDAQKPEFWPEFEKVEWMSREVILFESRMTPRLTYIPLHKARLKQ